MLHAITRQPSPQITQCELTHIERTPIDFELLKQQHDHYVEALRELGIQVTNLPTINSMADCMFVEDAAIVLDELAIITRPGAISRQRETSSIADSLTSSRQQLVEIQAPGTAEGGDVMRIGKTLFIGLSTRTNQEGIEQITQAVTPYGYNVIVVETDHCLHLKTGITQVAQDTLLINSSWLDKSLFGGYQFIDTAEGEDFATNAIQVGEKVLFPVGYPKTQQKLMDVGIDLHLIDVSEFEKAEAGLTCCSLIFKE